MALSDVPSGLVWLKSSTLSAPRSVPAIAWPKRAGIVSKSRRILLRAATASRHARQAGASPEIGASAITTSTRTPASTPRLSCPSSTNVAPARAMKRTTTSGGETLGGTKPAAVTGGVVIALACCWVMPRASSTLAWCSRSFPLGATAAGPIAAMGVAPPRQVHTASASVAAPASRPSHRVENDGDGQVANTPPHPRQVRQSRPCEPAADDRKIAERVSNPIARGARGEGSAEQLRSKSMIKARRNTARQQSCRGLQTAGGEDRDDRAQPGQQQPVDPSVDENPFEQMDGKERHAQQEQADQAVEQPCPHRRPTPGPVECGTHVG